MHRTCPLLGVKRTCPRDISKYSKKKVIFEQGDDADAVFYIKKGKIKVAVISDEGKEAIVALLGADEFVGEGCLVTPQRLATASANAGMRDNASGKDGNTAGHS